MLGVLVTFAAGPLEADGTHIDLRALQRLESPPLGLPPVPLPDGSEPTVEKIRLGRRLFFDRRLSRNGTMSCGMCHVPEQGFTSHELARPVGLEGRNIRRNAPTILNVAYVDDLFHDGRETSLETQALGPMLSPDEMGAPSLGWIVSRVRALDDYAELFQEAFEGEPSVDRIGEAIATWERTMLSAGSPFDRWRYGGDDEALTPVQKRGYELFTGRAGCASCHTVRESFALFTDQQFHDTGIGYRRHREAEERTGTVRVEISPGVFVSMDRAVINTVGSPEAPDAGRAEVTRFPADRWRYRTPTLRNVEVTAPYMHDGSMRTLQDVVAHYNRGGEPHAGLDPAIRPLGLTVEEAHALVAFLRSLTGQNLEELAADARSAPVGN